MRLRAIINKDGLLYMSIYDAIYISGEEQQAALPESEPAAPSDEQEQDTPAFTMSMG